ncbi:hypothetical protein [Agromyces sp. CF514]|uniref:hypothetical protein n=1 Tax=Agromyces sp. CF514 TaxID=1881031 RepID=UPI0011608AB7|nr:hypothetical protein [Agromyces sp. CF514]
MESIEWGSIADWFAAVGTVGALFATLYVIRSDQKSKRRQLADQVVTTLNLAGRYNGSTTEYSLLFNVSNFSPLSVIGIALIGPNVDVRNDGTEEHAEAMYFEAIVPDHEEMDRQLEGEADTNAHGLPPGESRSRTFVSTFRPPFEEFYVMIVDGQGRRWMRSTLTAEYVSGRKSKRIVQRAMDNQF